MYDIIYVSELHLNNVCVYFSHQGSTGPSGPPGPPGPSGVVREKMGFSATNANINYDHTK